MLYLKLSQNPGYILCAVQYILAAYFTIFLCKSSLYLSVPTLTFSLLPLSHWQNLPQSKSFNSDAVQCIRFSFHGLCFQGQVQTRMFCLALNLTGLPGGTVVKNPPANTGDAGDSGSTLGLGIPWRKKRQPTPAPSSVQALSYGQLCEPTDGSTPGFPVHHHLPEPAQTHVHRGDAIQPSHPLSSPSPAFNFSRHQRLFQWVSSSHQVANVLELKLQYQFFQWIFRADFLQDYCLENPMDRKA